jgi:hypothetical protein
VSLPSRVARPHRSWPVLVIVAAWSLPAHGEENEGPHVELGFSLLGGVGRRDLGDLNAQLERAGYRRFGETFTSIGIGVEAYLGRVVLGTELRFDSTPDAVSLDGTRNASLGAESIQLGGGYVVYRSRRLSVFPWLGVGYASNEVIAPPPVVQGDDDHVSESSLLVMPAVGFDTLLVPSRLGGSTGLFLGLRLGYAFVAPLHDWGGSALVTPDLAMAGPSLRIVLGYRIAAGQPTDDVD